MSEEQPQAAAADLRGRRLLVVLGSYKSKRHLYERARSLGVELSVLDGPSHWSHGALGKDLFSRTIGVDLAPFATFADRALEAIAASGLRFDGIGTIEEFAGGFTSRIAAQLGLPFHSIAAADAARDKHRAREMCAAAGLPSPRFARIERETDLGPAGLVTGFPAVLKPVSGVGSVQTYKVRDERELRHRFMAVTAQVERVATPAPVDSDRDWFALMWSGAPAFVLESWIEGRKYDADILLDDGRLVYGRATDDLDPCGLRDVRRVAPAGLDETDEDALIAHAAASVRALGFRDGAFNIEVKRTGDGPRTIEINGRLGGYSTIDIHQAVWGVDLVEQWLRSCFRMPLTPAPRDHACFVAESLLPAPVSGVLERSDFLDGVAERAGVLAARPWMFAGDRAEGVATGAPDWLGAVLTKGRDREEALRLLDAIVSSLTFPIRPQ